MGGSVFTQSALASINLIWPSNGQILSKFDSNKKGIQIAGVLGTPVVAAANGRVVYAGNTLKGYGNLIILKHDNTYLTTYAHNSKLLVKEGDTGLGKVVQGEGILGIPFALYIAGNVDTIMTLWPIDDDSTAEFVRRFFTKVKNGTPESAALSQTKREFLVDKKYMQPVFWAPFVMYGY